MQVETTVTMVAAVSLSVPVACWAAVRGLSKRSGDYWFLGALCGGLGALLLVLRPAYPGMDPLLKYHVTQSGVFLALLLRWHAIEEELGVPYPVRNLGRDVLLFLAVFSGVYALGAVWLAVLFASGCNAWLSWRFFLAAKRLRAVVPTAGLALILVFAALLLLPFSAQFLLGLFGAYQEPVGPEMAASPMALVSFGISILANFAWVGVVVHRANALRERELLAHETAQRRARMSQQLARVEAKNSIGVMSTALAHELGQPLATMLTTAQLCQRGLRDGRSSLEQVQALLDNILAAVARCTAIIEKTRLAHPSQVRPDSRADVGEVILQCVALGAADAESAGVQVSVNLPSERVWVRIDPVHLSQILVNLLRNAVQAASEAQARRVFVQVTAAGLAVRIVVADTGAGVPADMLGRVGTPFFTTRPEGLGMGLAVSRELLAAYGGTLQLQNAASGGLQATLEVPLANA